MEIFEFNSVNPYRPPAESLFLCGKLFGFEAECLVIENDAILPAKGVYQKNDVHGAGCLNGVLTP